MKCPKCQYDNPETMQFCGKCAATLEKICPKCGFLNPGEFAFCGKCAAALKEAREAPSPDYSAPQSYTPKFLAEKILTTRSSIEGERKLVTVLFADVADYTSMAEKLDPEQVHQIMDGCFKILMDVIHRYEGTINQFTGDGVMALFGAPVAHEDHAQRACHAALAIQNALKTFAEGLKKNQRVNFKMRIGLNSGPVVVGSIGDDLRMDYTAVGDTTNLAARMETLAKPGSVMVSEKVHRLTRDFFQFEPIGEVRVKGRQEALEAYELLKTTGVETRIEAAVAKGLTKFVGRRREIETLKEAFGNAQSKSGQVLGIVGEAGVGKSRLLLKFRETLTETECSYLEGRCLHYGGSMAYLPILDIMRSYFELKGDDSEDTIKKKLGDKLLKLDERLVSALLPLYELFSLSINDPHYVQITPQQRKQRVFEAIRDVLVLESEKQPVVLAVEDLHWIDKTSQEFLNYLVELLPNTSILLLLLYRPEYTHQWGSRSYYNKIGLDQLSAQTSAELVQSILEGGEISHSLKELILSRTGGNPLFMEEFTHSLLENGSIERKDNQYLLSGKPSDINIPDTIHGIIAARIDRIEEDLKAVMQVASVIGRDFAYRILQSITGTREGLKSHLLNLQGLELIYEKSLFPELEYIFKHAITQEVAYNSLLLQRRKELHERIGQAIETLYPDRLEEHLEILAHHYSRSDNIDKALEYLDRANQKAIKVSAAEEAVSYFHDAMRLLDTLPETALNNRKRTSLIINQGDVFLLLGKFKEYYDLANRYKSMAISLNDPGLLGAYYGCLGQCALWVGHFREGIQFTVEATKLCEEVGKIEDAAHACMIQAFNHLAVGNYEQAIALKERVVHFMDQCFNLRCYMWAMTAACWALSHLGRWEEAIEAGQKALETAKEYSDDSVSSNAAWIISWSHNWRGAIDSALEYAQLALEIAPTPVDQAWSQQALAWAQCKAGNPKRGTEILAALLPNFRGVFLLSELSMTLQLGEGYWLSEEFGAAKQTLENLVKIAKRCESRFYFGSAHRLLGEIALNTEPSAAASHFEKSVSVLEEIKAENELALAYSGYGRHHKQQGNIGQASEYLDKALEIFERLGTFMEPDKVRKELAELPKK